MNSFTAYNGTCTQNTAMSATDTDYCDESYNGTGNNTVHSCSDFRQIKSVRADPWPDIYLSEPHKVPNHYPPAPYKIIFKSNHVEKRKIIIKQPVSKMGFKRGQRNY